MLGEPLKSIRVESISRVDDRALMGHFLVTFKLVGLSPEVTISVSVSTCELKLGRASDNPLAPYPAQAGAAAAFLRFRQQVRYGPWRAAFK